MLVVQTRSNPLFKTTEVWFNDGVPPDLPGKALFYQSATKPAYPVFGLKEFHTLALPLAESEEQLFGRINRTFRYHIRKGEGLGLDYTVLDLIDKNNLHQFVETFNAFAQRKKLLPLPVWRAGALAKANGLVVTFLKREKELLTMHGYLVDGSRARLMTSHPVHPAETETIQGYVNKFHHWMDVLHFKRTGYAWYDFGGISPDGDGRSYFKQSFGGEHQVFFNYIKCSGLAKWLFTAKEWYEKFT